jgi:protein-disulfide isomerase
MNIHMENMERKPTIAEVFSAGQLFVGGIVTGLLVLCTIGFFILLSIVMKGGMNFGSGSQGDSYVPTPSAQGGGGSGAPVNVGVGHFPAQGKANAPVTVIEFADFRCPFCERFYNDAGKSIMTEYVATGKVKYYFRSFAFLGPESTAASEAAECANEQGKFWQFHDWMFDNQASESDLAYYSNDNLIKYAAGVGVDKAKFTQCLTSHKYAAKVAEDVQDAQAAGVNGTPTTFVNGIAIVGAQPYSVVKAAIDNALNK